MSSTNEASGRWSTVLILAGLVAAALGVAAWLQARDDAKTERIQQDITKYLDTIESTDG